MQIQHIVKNSSIYPAVFYQLHDPPKEIFVRGDVELLTAEPCIGIVGTRQADASGRQLAQETAKSLSLAGGVVVSGLAMGIDEAAHQGVVGVQGRTIAVLGSGIDDETITPRHNLGLAQDILKHDGLLISEYPPGYPAGKYTYPARNRLIAALVSHLIVIQAPLGSGALITVDHCLQLGRQVASFPGAALNAYWRGSNEILRDGATLLCAPSDALDWIGLQARHQGLSQAPEHLIPLLQIVQQQPCSVSVLVEQLKQPTQIVLRLLTQAEMQGLVRCMGGKWSISS